MNSRKRVLFVMPSYEIGGITVSLYSLLSKIDPARVEADILAAPVGAYKGKMPNCTELAQNIWLSYPYVGGGLLVKTFQTIVYGLRAFLAKVHINLFPLIYWIGGKSLGTDKYDAVVCFSEGIAYKVSCIPTKKYIQWIHCDYSRHLAMNNPQRERYAYTRADKVVCVSEYAKQVFSEIYPEFADKVVAIHNVLNVEDIQARAKDVESMDERFQTDVFTIISCGRLDPVKQFNMIPSIANRLKQITDKDFRWYILGDGDKEESNTIESEIKNFKLEEVVILLGAKSNPYPYMANAGLYVCTSQSESFPLVVNEAKALKVPVISNDFPSVRESIEEGIDGYVIPIEYMAEKICWFMNNLQTVLSGRIDNSNSLQEIYKLLEA